MKKIARSLIIVFSLFTSFAFGKNVSMSEGDFPSSANGIAFPVGYQSWSIIAVSHREDNKSLRAIIGNPAAIKAIEKGLTNPWPNEVILGKMVWSVRQDEHWPSATVPENFTHVEFMFKDSVKWKSTGGWGWARWLGEEQKPFGVIPSASDSCVACHTPVKGRDWVYTTPAIMPKRLELR